MRPSCDDYPEACGTEHVETLHLGKRERMGGGKWNSIRKRRWVSVPVATLLAALNVGRKIVQGLSHLLFPPKGWCHWSAAICCANSPSTEPQENLGKSIPLAIYMERNIPEYIPSVHYIEFTPFCDINYRKGEVILTCVICYLSNFTVSSKTSQCDKSLKANKESKQ